MLLVLSEFRVRKEFKAYKAIRDRLVSRVRSVFKEVGDFRDWKALPAFRDCRECRVFGACRVFRVRRVRRDYKVRMVFRDWLDHRELMDRLVCGVFKV